MQTTDRVERRSIPVRTVRAQVTAGPDLGAHTDDEQERIVVGTANGTDLPLTDATVSRYHAEFRADPAGIRVIDTGSTNGVSYLGARLEAGVVPPGSQLILGESTIEVQAGGGGTADVLADRELCGILGESPTMRRILARTERAARSDIPVLLIGESGTGKELFARALHDLSFRASAPFVTVDCGTLTPTLIASELFGHTRGSFTGASDDRIGAFEAAHGGTIFLDEIGELPAQLQVALLGVLERGSFRRVGGRDEIVVDVRVVAATNRDLRAEVNADRFRHDLYYRLAVLTLTLPPLRERAEDIPALLERFAHACGYPGELSELFSAKAIDQLCSYHWPGNVRELRNFVEATLALGHAPSLQGRRSADAPALLLGADILAKSYQDARADVVSDFEKQYIGKLLESCDDNVSAAARKAKMNRSYLSQLIRRLGLR